MGIVFILVRKNGGHRWNIDQLVMDLLYRHDRCLPHVHSHRSGNKTVYKIDVTLFLLTNRAYIHDEHEALWQRTSEQFFKVREIYFWPNNALWKKSA